MYYLIKGQKSSEIRSLRWAGHVIRMESGRETTLVGSCWINYLRKDQWVENVDHAAWVEI